jgi:hypothetical protein
METPGSPAHIAGVELEQAAPDPRAVSGAVVGRIRVARPAHVECSAAVRLPSAVQARAVVPSAHPARVKQRVRRGGGQPPTAGAVRDAVVAGVLVAPAAPIERRVAVGSAPAIGALLPRAAAHAARVDQWVRLPAQQPRGGGVPWARVRPATVRHTAALTHHTWCQMRSDRHSSTGAAAR